MEEGTKKEKIDPYGGREEELRDVRHAKVVTTCCMGGGKTLVLAS